jgi:hypothetical protein
MEIESEHARRAVPIVVDGANIAFSHGGDTFSPAGIALAVALFRRRGHDCFAFLPRRWYARQPAVDALIADGRVAVTPAQDEDDTYMIDYARSRGGYVLSNDRFRDHLQSAALREWAASHVISYAWRGDELVPNPAASQRAFDDAVPEHLLDEPACGRAGGGGGGGGFVDAPAAAQAAARGAHAHAPPCPPPALPLEPPPLPPWAEARVASAFPGGSRSDAQGVAVARAALPAVRGAALARVADALRTSLRPPLAPAQLAAHDAAVARAICDVVVDAAREAAGKATLLALAGLPAAVTLVVAAAADGGDAAPLAAGEPRRQPASTAAAAPAPHVRQDLVLLWSPRRRELLDAGVVAVVRAVFDAAVAPAAGCTQ